MAKSVQKVVLLSSDCSLTIPPGALKSEVEFQMLIDTDPDHFPEDRICISPILICKPSMSFDKPVTLQLTTYCTSTGEKVEILHKKRGMADWEHLEKSRLSDISSFKFKVTHFSQYTISLDPLISFFEYIYAKLMSLFRPNPHRILGNDVYINKDTAVIASAFYLFSKTQSNVNAAMESKGFVSILAGLPIEYECLHGDIMKLEMRCKEPENTEVKSYNSEATVKFSKKFQKKCPLFELDPALPNDYVGFLHMDYIITVTNRDQPESKFLVKKRWPIRQDDNQGNAATAAPSISADSGINEVLLCVDLLLWLLFFLDIIQKLCDLNFRDLLSISIDRIDYIPCISH